jgi:hypothetical protein
MLRNLLVLTILLVTVLSASPAPVRAQVSAGADVGLFSAYVWRGLTLTNKFVIEPELYISAYGFTGGFWFNIEPAEYNDPNDISQSGGIRSGLAETDPYLEYSHDFGQATTTLGWTGYWYHEDNGTINNESNTNEIYGSVSINELAVTPTVFVAYDWDEIKGTYIEPSLTYAWDASEYVSVEFGALAGFSAGMGINEEDENESSNFEGDGLTHVDLSVSPSYTVGSFSITPTLHFQINDDEFTKITGNDEDNLDHDTKWWGGVTLSWAMDFGATEEEEPEEPAEPTEGTEAPE